MIPTEQIYYQTKKGDRDHRVGRYGWQEKGGKVAPKKDCSNFLNCSNIFLHATLTLLANENGKCVIYTQLHIIGRTIASTKIHRSFYYLLLLSLQKWQQSGRSMMYVKGRFIKKVREIMLLENK